MARFGILVVGGLLLLQTGSCLQVAGSARTAESPKVSTLAANRGSLRACGQDGWPGHGGEAAHTVKPRTVSPQQQMAQAQKGSFVSRQNSVEEAADCTGKADWGPKLVTPTPATGGS